MRKIMLASTLPAVPNDEQWTVIRFLMLENVSGSEIHMRMCVEYSVQHVIIKSTVNC